jgi:hypothetical protein
LCVLWPPITKAPLMLSWAPHLPSPVPWKMCCRDWVVVAA